MVRQCASHPDADLADLSLRAETGVEVSGTFHGRFQTGTVTEATIRGILTRRRPIMDAGDRWLLDHFIITRGKTIDMARRIPDDLWDRVAPARNCPPATSWITSWNHRLPTRSREGSNFAIYSLAV